MTSKQDLRIKKTKHKIYAAFWKLLKEYDYSRIKVSDILTEAQINRSTFYCYYSDKDALLNKIEEQLINGFKKVALKVPRSELGSLSPKRNELERYYHQLVSFIYENSEKFSLLVEKGDGLTFLTKITQMDQAIWEHTSTINKLTIPKNYVFTGMVGLAVNLIKEWIEQNFQETPAEFKHILYEMTSPIILKGGIFADRAVNSND
jgi:AcrR family transcriptional regulator